MRTLPVVTLLVTLSFCCRKPGPPPIHIYPDCFKDLTASPYKVIDHCLRTVTTVELDKYKLVSIVLNDDSLNMTTACKTFHIADHPNAINIVYHKYAHAPDSTYFVFCTDVLPRVFGTSYTFKAVSGTVTTSVSIEKAFRQRCEPFLISIKLENVRFIFNAKQDTIITSLIIKDCKVGNCIPG